MPTASSFIEGSCVRKLAGLVALLAALLAPLAQAQMRALPSTFESQRIQANGTMLPEPTFDVAHVVDAREVASDPSSHPWPRRTTRSLPCFCMGSGRLAAMW